MYLPYELQNALVIDRRQRLMAAGESWRMARLARGHDTGRPVTLKRFVALALRRDVRGAGATPVGATPEPC